MAVCPGVVAVKKAKLTREFVMRIELQYLKQGSEALTSIQQSGESDK